VWLSRQKEVGIHNYCYQCDPAISLWGEQSPRVLIIVEDKAKVLEMEAIFENSKGILIWWCTEYMIGAIWNMIKIIFLESMCW
jgi:hypothetical protein